MNIPVFNNIEICFTHHGNSIIGFLNGDIRYWEFISDNELFLHYISSGILSSRFIISENFGVLASFVNDFYKEADKLVDYLIQE
jgi:hypothetical protein